VDPVDVPTLMNAADCLLLTSSLEGSPNVVKEALMCNLPVVATDVGDVAERLDGVEPSVVCQDLPDSLAAALHHCLAPRRRSNGREVSQELSAERIACRVLTLYDQVGDPGKGVRAALDAEVADEPR
jgi:glycosyltransferase involved in cell wall biosynthesis